MELRSRPIVSCADDETSRGSAIAVSLDLLSVEVMIVSIVPKAAIALKRRQ
jgi:hypothetical protein